MMTILAIVAGGLFLVGMGVLIGYKYCAWIHGKIFQALLNQGVMVLKTQDGWQGTYNAFRSIAMDKSHD